MIANREDYQPVAVLFIEPEIGLLFSELLQARGVQVQRLNNVEQYQGHTKIITEALYFPMLPEMARQNCLVVGNRDSLQKIDALCLTRPLTEEKIDSALQALLHT